MNMPSWAPRTVESMGGLEVVELLRLMAEAFPLLTGDELTRIQGIFDWAIARSEQGGAGLLCTDPAGVIASSVSAMAGGLVDMPPAHDVTDAVPSATLLPEAIPFVPRDAMTPELDAFGRAMKKWFLSWGDARVLYYGHYSIGPVGRSLVEGDRCYFDLGNPEQLQKWSCVSGSQFNELYYILGHYSGFEGISRKEWIMVRAFLPSRREGTNEPVEEFIVCINQIPKDPGTRPGGNISLVVVPREWATCREVVERAGCTDGHLLVFHQWLLLNHRILAENTPMQSINGIRGVGEYRYDPHARTLQEQWAPAEK